MLKKQIFWNCEFRQLGRKANEDLTLLDMMKYEENEHYLIPDELKVRVHGDQYPYKPGELELYQEKVLEENRSRLVKRGFTEDKIEKSLQRLVFPYQANKYAECHQPVSNWVKETNIQR